jgi:hypothetical protein
MSVVIFDSEDLVEDFPDDDVEREYEDFDEYDIIDY